MTAQADSISGTVSGQAPPGAQLTVTLYNTPLIKSPASTTGLGAQGGGWGGLTPTTLVVTATAQGEYQASFAALGGFSNQATGYVQFTTPEGYTVVRGFDALPRCVPNLESVQVGGNVLTVVTDEYGCPSTTLRLRDAQGQIKIELPIPAYSYYYNILTLFDQNGRPIPILPGDTIEIEAGSQLINLTPTPVPSPPTPTTASPGGTPLGTVSLLVTIPVPTLAVSLDAQANTISGRASPGAILSLVVYTAFKERGLTLTTTVSAQGSYRPYAEGGRTASPLPDSHIDPRHSSHLLVQPGTAWHTSARRSSHHRPSGKRHPG